MEANSAEKNNIQFKITQQVKKIQNIDYVIMYLCKSKASGSQWLVLLDRE